MTQAAEDSAQRADDKTGDDVRRRDRLRCDGVETPRYAQHHGTEDERGFVGTSPRRYAMAINPWNSIANRRALVHSAISGPGTAAIPRDS